MIVVTLNLMLGSMCPRKAEWEIGRARIAMSVDLRIRLMKSEVRFFFWWEPLGSISLDRERVVTNLATLVWKKKNPCRILVLGTPCFVRTLIHAPKCSTQACEKFQQVTQKKFLKSHRSKKLIDNYGGNNYLLSLVINYYFYVKIFNWRAFKRLYFI